jgi:surface-anchored protein
LPDATPTLPHLFTTVLDRQHTDINTNYNNGWVFGANNVDDGVVTPLDDTLLYINSRGRGVQPADPQWDFLGAGAGNPVWAIPQVRRPSLLFLGFRSQETAPGTFDSYFETDPRVMSMDRWETVTLKSVLGPGNFSLYQTDPFGNPQIVWMSASQGMEHPTDKIFVPEGGHFDYNWAFSQPGVYQVVVNVSGFIGDPPTLSVSDDVTFNWGVDTPDTPPTHFTPGDVTTAYQTPFTFQGATGLSVYTPEDHPAGIQTSLSVTAGSLTLGDTTGLTLVEGDGTDHVTLQGSPDAVNAALNGLVYQPFSGFSGTDTLRISTDDFGRYAPYVGTSHVASNHQTTTDTLTITVQPPGRTQGPGNPVVSASGALVFSYADGNPVSVFDLRSGSRPARVTPAQPAGLTVPAGTGTASQTATVTGPYADVNAALNGRTVNAPSAGAAGSTVATDDQGLTGTGTLTGTDPFAINAT